MLLAEVLEVGIELCPVVRDESSQDPKYCNDVLPYKILRVLLNDRGQRPSFNPLGEVIGCYNQPALVP